MEFWVGALGIVEFWGAPGSVQLVGTSRFLFLGESAKSLWRVWIAVSTLVIKSSISDVLISNRSRNSNKGAERCELYIFSILSPRPPMELSMLSSNFESASGEGDPLPMP